MNPIITLVQKEDLIEWGKKFWDNRILTMLWDAPYYPLTSAAQEAFNHDCN